MRRAIVAVAAVLVLPLASAVQCSSGEHVAKDCSVTYAGVRVDHGLVVDTVTPTCNVKPQQHRIQVQLEVEVGGEWLPQGRAAFQDTRPDRTGFPVRVQAPCIEGTWHTSVYTEGVGPNGDGFSHQEAGTEQQFSLVDCAS